MLNGRAICFGVFYVLFIPSAVFAQTDTIIEKIYQSEGKIREHVDKKVEGIETKISVVDTKVDNLSTKVGTLSADVAVNKTDIGNMKESIRDLKETVNRIWYGILGVFGTLILYFVKSWWDNRGKADNVDAVGRLNEQITNLTSAQAEISNQITKLRSSQTKILERISAQAEISATRNVPGHPKVSSMEGVDELTDDIRSQQRDAGGTV